MNKKLTARQEIIKHFQTSSFTRNKIKKLSELPSMMTDYDKERNSIGRNGIILKNGDKRNFIDYGGKTRIGTIYHHINNMWWVISSTYKKWNIGAEDIL